MPGLLLAILAAAGFIALSAVASALDHRRKHNGSMSECAEHGLRRFAFSHYWSCLLFCLFLHLFLD